MGRRDRGSGTVRKRSDGRWEGRILVGYDEKGLPKTKNVLAKTKMECEAKLEKLKSEIGIVRRDKVTPNMLFGEWIDFWYQNYKKLSLRPSTQAAYENAIYNHIIPEIGKIVLERLNANDLEQFYARMKKGGRLQYKDTLGEGMSDRMIRMCHAHCRSALEKALEDGLVHTNVAVGCKIPPKKAKEMKVLTEDEMQRFLIQAKYDGYFEICLLALTTGMRRGEIMGLQWQDLEKNSIFIVADQEELGSVDSVPQGAGSGYSVFGNAFFFSNLMHFFQSLCRKLHSLFRKKICLIQILPDPRICGEFVDDLRILLRIQMSNQHLNCVCSNINCCGCTHEYYFPLFITQSPEYIS